MEQNTQAGNENTTEFLNVHEQLKEYAAANVFGADFDPFLIRAAQMNMVLAGDGRGHIYNINSLEFPLGHLADLPIAKKEIPLGSVDIIATNPPFGSDIPITDKHILSNTSWLMPGSRMVKAVFATPVRQEQRIARDPFHRTLHQVA